MHNTDRAKAAVSIVHQTDWKKVILVAVGMSAELVQRRGVYGVFIAAGPIQVCLVFTSPCSSCSTHGQMGFSQESEERGIRGQKVRCGDTLGPLPISSNVNQWKAAYSGQLHPLNQSAGDG
ncbi:hypothetical protein WMY93_029060 [Mugilogobius chulae]|uniref:Uncharacterized protein n=1 Tax=Mugilogobius chulae TaxID=88201 RepID=A0AAW0MW70_9GOBI